MYHETTTVASFLLVQTANQMAEMAVGKSNDVCLEIFDCTKNALGHTVLAPTINKLGVHISEDESWPKGAKLQIGISGAAVLVVVVVVVDKQDWQPPQEVQAFGSSAMAGFFVLNHLSFISW